MLIAGSVATSAALSAFPSFGDDSVHLDTLMNCYARVKPFSTTGSHATVYPSDQNFIFIPGSYSGRDGVYVYSDQGTSFIAIDDAFSKKPVSFDVSSKRGPMSVIYQPANEKQHAQVWLRGASNARRSGVNVVFKAADDPERRAPLEAELDAMARGMSKTWDMREDQIVQSVEQGKYLWVEVDLDHYKDVASFCLKTLHDAGETMNLHATFHEELESLNVRAGRSGLVRVEGVPQNSFMTTPQY